MGAGIAHVCALAGYQVLLNDLAPEKIRSGLATISGNLARQLASEKITEKQRDAAVARLAPADAVRDLASCDIVIEAATENEAIKRKIFAELVRRP